jgi:hypothetical protein
MTKISDLMNIIFIQVSTCIHLILSILFSYYNKNIHVLYHSCDKVKLQTEQESKIDQSDHNGQKHQRNMISDQSESKPV